MKENKNFQIVLNMMLCLWKIWFVLAGAELVIAIIMFCTTTDATSPFECLVRIDAVTTTVIYPITVLCIALLIVIQVFSEE